MNQQLWNLAVHNLRAAGHSDVEILLMRETSVTLHIAAGLPVPDYYYPLPPQNPPPQPA